MTIASKPIIPSARDLPELHSGDRMTREEFHRIYSQMPEDFKAELIGGIVYVAPPLKLPHGTSHPLLSAAFVLYAGNTPGVEVGDNTTILLGDQGEPQPDLFLRILPEHGGQSQTTRNPSTGEDEYVRGAPELIAEVAHSSRSIDLHAKRADYWRYGVREYIVTSLKERQLRWFDLSEDRELPIDPDGVLRAKAFPGLWIHAPSLLAKDVKGLMSKLNEGLATPEHQAFVQQLSEATGRTSS
jgi:Uma2 family endonuclease